MDQIEATSPQCGRAACPRAAEFPCSYVDRRRRACDTHWCAQHALDIAGKQYCARHASTVIAVGQEALNAGHLPELDNRVPSLVYWVGRDLDTDIPVILATIVNEGGGETLVVDPVALVAGGGRVTERRWERNWKVVSHTGISQKVTLQVLEGAPDDIVLRVGRVVVARETPPWIAAHDAGRVLDPDEDHAERRAFYHRLHDAISAALVAEEALPYY